jgi:peptidoglycan hydrolase-like protein with peptidoglycan-binding domain
MAQAYKKYKNMTPQDDIFRVTDVRSMQMALVKLEYDPGVIDGLWGSNTSSAVRAFQKSYHLPNTGGRELETMTAIQAAYYERLRKGEADADG